MKQIIFVLAIILVAACIGEKSELPMLPPTKPFIVYKVFANSAMCNDDDTRYYYVDANGSYFDFCDSPDLYHVGDTIK